MTSRPLVFDVASLAFAVDRLSFRRHRPSSRSRFRAVIVQNAAAGSAMTVSAPLDSRARQAPASGSMR